MGNPRGVAAVMVAWNSMKWLPGAIRSLRAQSRTPDTITVVDNASTDGLGDFLRQECPDAQLIRNEDNRGFAAAVNQGIRATRSEWVLVLNPDVELGERYLERLLLAVADRPDAGSAGGLLRRPDLAVDSAGLELLRHRLRPLDRTRFSGAGPGPVFGVCAAAALYRRSMLADVEFQGQPFDEVFFAYYEDVDLAWRARHRGWTAWFVPGAPAMHVRGASGGEQSRAGQIRSQRNRYLAIYKNLPARNFWSDALPILGIELLRLVRHLPTQVPGLWGFLGLAASRRAWRKWIQSSAVRGSDWYLRP